MSVCEVGIKRCYELRMEGKRGACHCLLDASRPIYQSHDSINREQGSYLVVFYRGSRELGVLRQELGQISQDPKIKVRHTKQI